jgi:ribonuclease HI
MSHKAFFDGSCFLHYCGIGYVIRDSSGAPVCEAAEFVGRGDALKAEYLALRACLDRLAVLGIHEAVIHGDSRTVVGQVKGQINTRERNRFRDAIMQIRRLFTDHPLAAQWIPRAKQEGRPPSYPADALQSIRRNSLQTFPRPLQNFHLGFQFPPASNEIEVLEEG